MSMILNKVVMRESKDKNIFVSNLIKSYFLRIIDV
jgi:hypothetical protein